MLSTLVEQARNDYQGANLEGLYFTQQHVPSYLTQPISRYFLQALLYIICNDSYYAYYSFIYIFARFINC